MINFASILKYVSVFLPVIFAADVQANAQEADSKPLYDFSQDITSDYKPITEEEKELWEAADKIEAKFLENSSSKIIDDPALNAYVKGILCKVIGDERCAPIRLYLVRTTRFNALMAPNGMMQIWSGLLIRMENEAQLASILAHEYAHYVRRHSLQTLKLAKNLEWSSSVPYVGLITSVGAVGSILSYRREMESEADKLALNYIYEAGYDPRESSEVWRRLLAEFEVTKPKREESILGTFFSTHPSSEKRLLTLTQAALGKGDLTNSKTNTDIYKDALGDWRSSFINDQLAAKDYKTGEYLVNQLAENGWDNDLYYAKAELYRKRGRKGDFALAAQQYQKAIDNGSEKAENWRGLGLSLMRDNKRDDGAHALREYLKRLPDAVDKSLIQLLVRTIPKKESVDDSEESL